MSGTWAILPAKSFDAAKSRLSAILSARERARLAWTMFDHVLSVLERSAAIEGVLVATDSDEIGAVAERRGALVVRDPARPEGGVPLGAIIDRALDRLAAAQAEAALVLMSDLPQLELRDVDRLLSALSHADLVLAPDHQEAGTNALALRPARRLATCFGHADSFARHVALAEAERLRVAVARSPGLALDLDTPEDAARLAPEWLLGADRSQREV